MPYNHRNPSLSIKREKKKSLQKIFYISVLKSHLYTGQTEVFFPGRVIYHLNDFHSRFIYGLGEKQTGRQDCGVLCQLSRCQSDSVYHFCTWINVVVARETFSHFLQTSLFVGLKRSITIWLC